MLGAVNLDPVPEDFPHHKLADPFDEASVLGDDFRVFGSQGVHQRNFNVIREGRFMDRSLPVREEDLNQFNQDGETVRQVEPRHTPSVINSVHNFRNFWDGRANFIFNGVGVFGNMDPDAEALKNIGAPGDAPVSMRVEIDNASLASQAVGPIVSSFEMSFKGRTRAEVGQKMLALTPLARQKVHPKDSVFGPAGVTKNTRRARKGLSVGYDELIEAAFEEVWWNGDEVTLDTVTGPQTFSHMEANFPLFFGLAVQLYEATLVSDQTPFDEFSGRDFDALTETERLGAEIFFQDGLCGECHFGPELTLAATNNIGPIEPLVEQMFMASGPESFYDSAFYNLGLRPIPEDFGAGGTDPFGNPLSVSVLSQLGIDPGFPITTNSGGPVPPGGRVAMEGTFKTPGLRNVELTGPFFHNGGPKNLTEVVQFYSRGGNFGDENILFLVPQLRTELFRLRNQPDNVAAVVAFLKALTDERVRFERAPFDHPSLKVPDGHIIRSNGTVKDNNINIREVGATGRSTPLLGFEERL